MQAIPIASSLFSFAAGNAQAKLAKAAGEADRQQAQMVAEDYRIRAAQEDADRIRDFYGTLGTIEADLAGRGVGRSLDSGTGQAIEKALFTDARRNRLNVRGSYARKAGQTEFGGRLAEFQGRASAFGYKTQAAMSLFSAAQQGLDLKIGGKTVGSRLGP